MQFRSKPKVIEAVRYSPHMTSLPEWLAEIIDLSKPLSTELEIVTLEGTMVAREGDWVIQGIKGELYPCKHEIFIATYEPTVGL